MNDLTDADVRWPTHAYIPGVNERHVEDAFDSIKSGLTAGMSVPELAASSAFQHGLYYLDGGYYWEAHELFEPVWMSLPDNSDEKQFVQALIQVANAYLKHRMHRAKACLRLCDISRQLLSGLEDAELMGVRKASIIAMISDLEVIQ